MHGSSLKRMEWFVRTYLLPLSATLRVLDIGSYDVAGGTYRQFFPTPVYEYHGLDLENGPNVDIIPSHPYHWPEIANNVYDVVISGQAFEHMEFFWLTALEMTRVLKPGGLMCIIAPRGFETHRHPVDCYRFDRDGMTAIAHWCNLEIMHASTDMEPEEAEPGWHIEGCEDSLLVARKPQNWPGPIDPHTYELAKSTLELTEGFRECERVVQPEKIELVLHEQIKAQLEERILQKEREIRFLHQRISGYENSNSWRITRPLRNLRKLLRQLFHDSKR